jgi:hypothetical protein
MSEVINKEIAKALYLSGKSIPQCSEETGIAVSTLRFYFKREGILRSREDGVRIAAEDGRLGTGMLGKKRVFSKKHKDGIRQARIAWGEQNAKGFRLNSNGYMEFTRGEHKGRQVHVVAMESRLGRRLKNDECVHHIDGDKLNNEESNLALVTLSGHARLHRHEDKLAGKVRGRNENGTWC